MKELFDYDQEFEELQAMLIAKSNERAPEHIYLQRTYDDLEEPRPGALPWPKETTWCVDAIEDYDVEYTRSSIVKELRAENGRLRAKLDEARELMAEIEFRIVSEGYSFEDIQETAGHIDRMLTRTGYRT